MKYMGHKGRILSEILDVVDRHSEPRDVFVDAMCGSSIVAWSVSECMDRKVIASDLQKFATMRASAVIERTSPAVNISGNEQLLLGARERFNDLMDLFPNRERTLRADDKSRNDVASYVIRSRKFCVDALPHLLHSYPGDYSVTRAYGGYYFSPEQALYIDCLRNAIEACGADKNMAMSALIDAASRCSASPGHTAQPFQPSHSGIYHIIDAWKRDVFSYFKDAYNKSTSRYAKRLGRSIHGDYSNALNEAPYGSLVFVDPPYSNVQYSRFYHVLETICTGNVEHVSGVGRYPDISVRPQSAFSQRSASSVAMRELLGACRARGLRVLVTFPTTVTSNGLSAAAISGQARELGFSETIHKVTSDFSSLGGKPGSRAARKNQEEAIMLFQ